jgi:hypothetical protein
MSESWREFMPGYEIRIDDYPNYYRRNPLRHNMLVEFKSVDDGGPRHFNQQSGLANYEMTTCWRDSCWLAVEEHDSLGLCDMHVEEMQLW